MVTCAGDVVTARPAGAAEVLAAGVVIDFDEPNSRWAFVLDSSGQLVVYCEGCHTA